MWLFGCVVVCVVGWSSVCVVCLVALCDCPFVCVFVLVVLCV